MTLVESEPPRLSIWPGRTSRPELRFTYEQLAEMVGTHRETATKVLNEWREQGLIELKRGKVVLLDLEALRRLSAD